MATVQDTLIDQLAADFASACTEFEHARLLVHTKDTPAHRVAVAEWADAIDVLLDTFLEAGRPQRAAGPPCRSPLPDSSRR